MKEPLTCRATTGGYLFYIDDFGRRVWVDHRPPDIDDPAGYSYKGRARISRHAQPPQF